MRGARVEPAEVEGALSEHTGLAQAVVVAGEGSSGQQRPVAHAVPADGRTVPPDELRRSAAGRPPEAVVPSVFRTRAST
ncbi:hypothetical protein ACF1FC_13125 [Streptomyces sp. NPDC014344]|uniref:AMP-binding enzyme n=1 Tax=Streptomyces sp. NPDC014344 TaxID=3364871 RepID=UPI0036F73A71